MWRNLKTATLALALTMASAGVAVAQDGRYYDRDDYSYGRERNRIARDVGYEDGTQVGREDFARRKPYNPYPRGRYAHEDHGYRREYGDRYAYMSQYARAYQEGYERACRRY
jgi:hypothetical protein